MFAKTGNNYLDTYMQMVEETESPRLFHLWCAISSVAAALGRRTWLPFGDSCIYPNIYVLLVGNAATRKSTAMNTGKSLVRNSTDVRFAPDSTAGKYQGLVSAMFGEKEKPDDELQDSVDALENALSTTTLGGIPFGSTGKTSKSKLHIAEADRHTLYVAASEFNTFIGHNNLELLEFLGKMYDGEDYEYGLRNETETLDNPLLNLVGCTTPTNIATAMPAEAIGQGFTSRIILVYGQRKYKSISRPPPFARELRASLLNHLKNIYFNFAGPFEETASAYHYADRIYERRSDLVDSRFTYYLARRHTHFLKLGMIIAAMRGQRVVDEQDYLLADSILIETEKHMPDALGEYGMSPISMAKQRIVEFVRAVDFPVTTNYLWSMLGRDIRMTELASCVQDLIANEKIQQVKITTNSGSPSIAYIPYSNVTPETLEIIDHLQSNAGTGTLQ